MRKWIQREREGIRDLAILMMICLGIILVLSGCRTTRDDTWLGVKKVYGSPE